MIKSLKDLLDKFSRFTNSLVYDGEICKRLENIKISLSTFYKIVLLIIVIIFIALMLLAVPSFSKFGSFIGLCFLFITTGLLFYGNYQEEQINKDFNESENIEIIELNRKDEVIEKSSTKNESKVIENFIA